MLQIDRIVCDTVGGMLGQCADRLVAEHVSGITQEHQLTSRLAGVIEDRFNGVGVFDYRLSVITQEFSDKGPGSLEYPSGADLYIGFRLFDGIESMSKGMFIQSKFDRRIRVTKERRDLVNQCKKLVDRTPASYLWVYGAGGIHVAFAQDIVDDPLQSPRSLAIHRVSDQVSHTLDCTEGDPDFGLPEVTDVRAALGGMLEEFAIPTGIAISAVRTVGVIRAKSV